MHQPPMAGEGAEIRIVPGIGGGRELDEIRLAKADQPGAGGEDFRALREVVLGKLNQLEIIKLIQHAISQ